MAVLAVNIGDIMKGTMIMGYEYQEKFVDKANEILANQMKTKPEWIDRKALIKALEADFNTDWADYASKNNFDKDYIDGVRDEYDDVLTTICKQRNLTDEEAKMYQSPINIIETAMKMEMENEYMSQIKCAIGLDINKEELIRALKYDREQYQKGYEDAKAKALELIMKYVPDDDGTCSNAGADLRELLDEIEDL